MKGSHSLTLQREPFGHSSRPLANQATVIRTQHSAAPIAILGVPFDNVTTAETVARIEAMVESKQPHYLVTPNVDFLVQALSDVELRRILLQAHLVLCDGTPLVWASKLLGNPLPERVAGSDLVPLLIRIAAEKQYRVFFLGGSPETANRAVTRLKEQLPTLQIVGCESPPYSALLDMDHEGITRRIQFARPDLLFVCFGCPKQEKWMAMHYQQLGVPVCVGVGGTIDFLAGRLARAPRWMQRTGLEWTFRLAQEPRRLMRRYMRDIGCFSWALLDQWWQLRKLHISSVDDRAHEREEAIVEGNRRCDAPDAGDCAEECCKLVAPDWLDRYAVEEISYRWENVLAHHRALLADLSRVNFIDSTGIGFLIRLQKRARVQDRNFVLVELSAPVKRALEKMQVDSFFKCASDSASVIQFIHNSAGLEPATAAPQSAADEPLLIWQGEIVASNATQVWETTEHFVRCQGLAHQRLAFDLSRLKFIDSTGAGLMVRAKQLALQLGLELRFQGVQPDVRNVLRVSKFEEFLL